MTGLIVAMTAVFCRCYKLFACQMLAISAAAFQYVRLGITETLSERK